MHAHLPKQHSCGRGSQGSDGGRSMPPVARDAHCACRWHQHPPGLQYSSQALPSWGPGGAASQSRSKFVPLWDTGRRSPHKSPAKPQGSPGEWWSECACAHGWSPPAQVSQFFTLRATLEDAPGKESEVWRCRQLFVLCLDLCLVVPSGKK